MKTKTTKISAAQVIESIVSPSTEVATIPATEPAQEASEEPLSPSTDLAVIPTEEPAQEPQEEAPTGPILYVDSPIKKALFDEVLRGEFEPGKKFGGKSQANLAAPWKGITVLVDPVKVGRTFEAQKGNWNFNDSNFVNPQENYTRLAKAAREANGGVEVAKKTLVGHLEDLKLICQKMAA